MVKSPQLHNSGSHYHDGDSNSSSGGGGGGSGTLFTIAQLLSSQRKERMHGTDKVGEAMMSGEDDHGPTANMVRDYARRQRLHQQELRRHVRAVTLEDERHLPVATASTWAMDSQYVSVLLYNWFSLLFFLFCFFFPPDEMPPRSSNQSYDLPISQHLGLI